MSALKKERVGARYTYADYQTWGDDTRVELIDGVIYNMAAPSQKHQWLLFELGALFREHLKSRGAGCRVLVAPSDVRLNSDKADDTVVQPDLFIVCDKNKLDGQNCNGAPDLVVEILSPSTASRDRVLKFNQYLAAGVREYWIIDMRDNTIQVHTLTDEKYTTRSYAQLEEDDRPQVPVGIFEGFSIDLVALFAVMEF